MISLLRVVVGVTVGVVDGKVKIIFLSRVTDVVVQGKTVINDTVLVTKLISVVVETDNDVITDERIIVSVTVDNSVVVTVSVTVAVLVIVDNSVVVTVAVLITVSVIVLVSVTVALT